MRDLDEIDEMLHRPQIQDLNDIDTLLQRNGVNMGGPDRGGPTHRRDNYDVIAENLGLENWDSSTSNYLSHGRGRGRGRGRGAGRGAGRGGGRGGAGGRGASNGRG